MRNVRPCALAAAALFLCQSVLPARAATEPFQPGTWQAPGIEQRIDMQTFRQGDLTGELYMPKNAVHRPALLVLGACSKPYFRGTAQGFADHGYVALVLFYCGPDTPRPTLQETPVELFKTALDWLRGQPSVDPDRVGIFGGSAGTTAGLLTAAHFGQVKALVLFAPGSIAPQTPGLADPKSMYTLGGVPLPYIHTLSPTVLRSPDLKSGVIPVEKIRAPMLLISGDKDESWPAAVMAEVIAAKVRKSGSPFPVVNLIYPDAGHGFFAAHDWEDPWFAELYPRTMNPPPGGGTLAGSIAAAKDSWPKTLAFLQKNL